MPSAFVLAAGLGTRLRPLTDHVPKALVPIGDRPALQHVVERLRTIHALDAPGRVVVNAFHEADAVLGLAERAGVLALREATLLGTAGGLRNAAGLLGGGDVLVWNADIHTELDPRGLLGAHAASSALATLAVAPRAGAGSRGQGTVGLATDGRVVRLRGETFGDEARGADFVGIHVVGAALREALPEVGCLVGDVYLPALRRGGTLGTLAVTAPFVDVGTLASYLEANLVWLDARRMEAFVASGARVRPGARVHRSVVGEGAHVDADVDECVVWSGAHVTAPLRRAIATPFGTFAVTAA